MSPCPGRQATLHALLAAMLLAGCANFTPSIRPADAVQPAHAYLYGRFHLKVPEGSLSGANSQTLAFVFRCDDGTRYAMPFSTFNGVQAIETTPGRCSFTEVIFTDGNLIKRRQATPDPWKGPLNLVAGRAYYLGDFHGTTALTSERMLWVVTYEMSWGFDSWEDSYDTTTIAMQGTYPNLTALPTEDHMLVPRRPGQRRPRLPGAGGGVATSPTDVMTPERIASVAPFIKRSYATPADCEAACPTGDCLPYRGESGPAMTCIVRCKTDKNCPDGLRCNCPVDQGQACHLIATTPTDAMAGLCLSVETTGERR